MMNNFAGPSDTQNFAPNNNEIIDNEGAIDDENSETPQYMGNHIVKTVRNLRMSANSQKRLLEEEGRYGASSADHMGNANALSQQHPL